MDHRSRSVPYKRVFVSAIIYTLVFYLCVIAFLTTLVAFAIVPKQSQQVAAYILVALLPICAFSWIIAYFKRRKATCPLCKCTPFLDNLAHKHQKAFRIKPLNYGTTAMLNVVFTQRWRCMYCGTPFDILKTRNAQNYTAYKESSESTEKEK